MKKIPNLGLMSHVIDAYRRGVLTQDEAVGRIDTLMELQSFIHFEEDCEYPRSSASTDWATAGLHRIEQKLDSIFKHLHISCPDELDPMVITEDVKELLRENNKIGAIQMHRARTGIGLAHAKLIIDDHLKQGNRL